MPNTNYLDVESLRPFAQQTVEFLDTEEELIEPAYVNKVSTIQQNVPTTTTGRRYNSNKASIELIPLTLIADSFLDSELTESGRVAKELLSLVGQFQASGETWYLDNALHVGNKYWKECADGFAFGKIKYDEWNWAGGMKWSVPLACAGRHGLAVMMGEDIDADSKVHHIGLIMCNIVMLRTFVETYPKENDLPAIGLLPIYS